MIVLVNRTVLVMTVVDSPTPLVIVKVLSYTLVLTAVLVSVEGADVMLTLSPPVGITTLPLVCVPSDQVLLGRAVVSLDTGIEFVVVVDVVRFQADQVVLAVGEVVVTPAVVSDEVVVTLAVVDAVDVLLVASTVVELDIPELEVELLTVAPVVLATGVVLVMPPDGVTGTQTPLSSLVSVSMQAEVVEVVVVVTDVATQDPAALVVWPSRHDKLVVVATVVVSEDLVRSSGVDEEAVEVVVASDVLTASVLDVPFHSPQVLLFCCTLYGPPKG